MADAEFPADDRFQPGTQRPGSLQAREREGIRRLEGFFHSLGLGTRLSDLGVGSDRLDEMASKCTNADHHTVGNFVKLDRAAVRKILGLAA